MSAPPGYTLRDIERWAPEDRYRQSERPPFARDRGRLVHSSALRRLAAKTQVLAPGSDDFVRNRLTHTLEVAQIGRELGADLGCDPELVDTACLAHDLGHPPFGHTGEDALDALCADNGGFEGNAQTLRLLTRLEAKRTHPDGRPAGLNLTRAGLDAATKYPWSRHEGPLGQTSGKFGVYADDTEVFTWMRAGAPAGRRCLEAQVMDWADDVAYCVHDVEDAVASGRLDLRSVDSPEEIDLVTRVAHERYAPDLSPEQLADALRRLRAEGMIPRTHDGSRVALAELKDMTSTLIGRFVTAAREATLAEHGHGDAGPRRPRLTRYAADLTVPEAQRAEVAVLKAVAAHFVMLTDERRTLQSVQHEVIDTLVHDYLADPGRLDPAFRTDWVEAERRGDESAALRVVVDQVAGLTDARAFTLARPTGGRAPVPA